MKIAITWANSSVGQNMLAHACEQNDFQIIAGVRSDSAAASLPSSAQIQTRIINYNDVSDLTKALDGADAVVHLAGILMENKGSDYQTANVEATAAVVEAAKNIDAKHFVFISVVGADAASPNRYFKSKGDAEKLVMSSGIASTVIRTPILLGPGTAGADSICGAASQEKVKLLGGGNYTMRPLDIDDLSTAIINSCLSNREGSNLYELVGPEPSLYSDLIRQVSNRMDKQITIGTLPIWTAKLVAAITSRIKGGGISPTVIDVITMNEVVEKNADIALGVNLTPLSNTLEKIIANKK
jgi:uncharacterized protein YbjT (DUF2867 family)